MKTWDLPALAEVSIAELCRCLILAQVFETRTLPPCILDNVGAAASVVASHLLNSD